MPLKYTPSPDAVRIADSALNRRIASTEIREILEGERRRTHERLESVLERSEEVLYSDAPDEVREQAAQRRQNMKWVQESLPSLEQSLSDGMQNVLGAMDGLLLSEISPEFLLDMLPEEEKEDGKSALHRLIDVFAWREIGELGLDPYINSGDVVEAKDIIRNRLNFPLS